MDSLPGDSPGNGDSPFQFGEYRTDGMLSDADMPRFKKILQQYIARNHLRRLNGVKGDEPTPEERRAYTICSLVGEAVLTNGYCLRRARWPFRFQSDYKQGLEAARLALTFDNMRSGRRLTEERVVSKPLTLLQAIRNELRQSRGR